MVSFATASFPPSLFLLPYLTLSTTPAKYKQSFVFVSYWNKKKVSVLRRCKAEANWDLEGEILNFMKKSEKSGAFPGKKELINAGRMDLVDGIQRQGGWLSLGWDLDDNVDCNLSVACKFEVEGLENSSSDESSASGFDERRGSSGGCRNPWHTESLGERKKCDLWYLSKDTEDAVDDRQPGSSIVAVDETSSEKLRELSDAWEFQETEIVHAKDQLRSIRDKLSVIEGKMALAIKDVQKLFEVKQKRIDDTHRALLNLRNACIVWPNSASEVFMAGSFDGWATQKKMEKSSTGIFSLSLKLYPGRYEIKFIVDGEWKIDPLRPVVNNNGFENNLLTIA